MISNLLVAVALGHEFAPSVLALERLDDAVWEVRWRPSPTDLGEGVFLEPLWPEGCRLEGDRLMFPGLDRIAIPGVVQSVAEVLVRVRREDEEVFGVITPGQPEWTLPSPSRAAPPWRRRAVQTIAGAWAVLGAAHLLSAPRARWLTAFLWLVGVSGAVGLVAALFGCHQ